MASLRCRLGLHRRTSTRTPSVTPGVDVVTDVCERDGCTHRRVDTVLAIGWVRESVCDTLACGWTREHRPHVPSQLHQIDEQRRLRAADPAR